MDCRNCGNDHAIHGFVRVDKDGKIIENCDQCGAGYGVAEPDVYWPGHAYASENITDRNGSPILLESKRHKAEVMKKMGISEAGDKVHGAPYVPGKDIKQTPQEARREVREALEKAVFTLKRKYG